MESNSVVLRRSWASAWDAVRYMGDPPLQKPTFSLPMCKTQLDLAAQAVVRLREAIEKNRTSTEADCLPLEGSSTMVLGYALDGVPMAGSLLPMPYEDPEGFVTGLVKAAFKTGDGEYGLGVIDEAAFDELIEQHCKDLMSEAQKLLRPMEYVTEVEVSIAELSAAVKSLLDYAPSVEPNSIDAIAFSNRIIQLKQDIHKLSQQALELPSPPKTPEVDEEKDVEMKDERQSDDVIFENVPDAQGEAEGEQTPLARTKSQVVKRLKIDEVGKMAVDKKESVEQLRRVLSQLEKPSEENEETNAKASYDMKLEALNQVQKLQKSFRWFGEDLMEGMLALDQISGLHDEDRAARKSTLHEVQELLDKIDVAKPRIAKMQKQLNAELEQLKPASPEQTAPEPPAPEPPKPKQASNSPSLSLPKINWSKVRLNPKFDFQENSRFYVLAANMPGLNTESIKLTRPGGQQTLGIQGVRVPSEVEQQQMNNILVRHLKELSRQERAQCTQEDVEEWMVELGHERFGLFSQEFELPADVDWDSIDPSYEGGVLRIILPRRATRPMFASDAGAFGYPGYAPYPAHRRGRGARGLMPDFMW